MNYTHAQILGLTGMTPDRLRHWRKEIPGLDGRAARGGAIGFEEIALLAVLSQATDELGIAVSLIAAHYEDLLLAFKADRLVGEPNVALWLTTDSATISPISTPPDLDIGVMIRLAPIIQRLYDKIHLPETGQLSFLLDSDPA